ncbi:hypothetical protein [Streptomyces bluensis]|uniref:Uncharacterized protein n=1 Tax=Streptomyces bluensis TaxID=33897 RepID=A0ABW6UJ70_9ACTN
MTTPRLSTLPGPTFRAGIQVATGVHRNDTYTVAQVLTYHVPPTPGQSEREISDGMQAIAASLRLGAHDEAPPFIGHGRIQLAGITPHLNYGRDDSRIALPVGEDWRTVAQSGAAVRVIVLFDPLWPGGGQNALAAHVDACYDRGTLRWGTTFL